MSNFNFNYDLNTFKMSFQINKWLFTFGWEQGCLEMLISRVNKDFDETVIITHFFYLRLCI